MKFRRLYLLRSSACESLTPNEEIANSGKSGISDGLIGWCAKRSLCGALNTRSQNDVNSTYTRIRSIARHRPIVMFLFSGLWTHLYSEKSLRTPNDNHI